MNETASDRLQLEARDAAAIAEPARGQRGLRGLYSASQRERLAANGSALDVPWGDYVVSSAWRDPACEHLRCWRPEILRMVPPEARRCHTHGRQTPPAEDPFPLEGQELAAAKAKAWAALAPKYDVPFMYQDMAGWTETPALRAALAFADVDGAAEYSCRAVVLEGRPGCGKTAALYAALRVFVLDMVAADRKDDIRFYTFPQLSRLLLDEDERDGTLEALCEADELLLDDLGAGFTKPSGFVVSLLEEALIHRESHRYPVLATTNLDPRRFRTLFGERVFDRLKGLWGVWISVDRPSLRMKGPATR